jgi:hypothetical protein
MWNLPVIGKFPVVAETNLPISGKLLIYSLSICCFSIWVDKNLPSGIGGHQNHSLTFYSAKISRTKFTNTVTFLPDIFRFKTLGNSWNDGANINSGIHF